MLRRLIWLFVAFPAAVVLIAFSVANRHQVRFVLDPFQPQDPLFYLEMPFFVYLFAALLLGMVLGGMATWLRQGKWRRTARRHAHEARRWKAEAGRHASQAAPPAAASSHSGVPRLSGGGQ